MEILRTYNSMYRPVTIETRCFHKKLEFQRYPPKDFGTARYERKSSKKKFHTFLKPRKNRVIPGPILGQDRPEKNSAKCLFEAARYRTNDGAMKSERGAPVRGSDPPSGHSVRASDTNTFGCCCVENRRQKISIPLRWQKIGLFSGLGEERRTPRAISRL